MVKKKFLVIILSVCMLICMFPVTTAGADMKFGCPGSRATGETDTEEPDTEEPDTEEPDTEEPGTEEPGTEEPDTEEPDTEEPDTKEDSISDCTIEMGNDMYIYDGTAKRPAIVVKDGDVSLDEDEDYTLLYSNNTNVGRGVVSIIGMGDYTGTEKKTFTIASKDVSDLNYKYMKEVNYRGRELRPGVTITYGNLTLKNFTDYVITYENNKNAGTASMMIMGTGNYTGVKKLTFTIAPKPISSTLARLDDYTFLSDGWAKMPEVIVMSGRERLVENKDYKVTYVNNIKPGVAAAVLEGIGNFGGTIKIKYTIRIGTPVISSVENTSSGIKVSWGKVEQAESYKLFRRVKNDTPWELAANVAGTSYTDTAARKNGAVYQYKVYAYTSDVLSNPSGFKTICCLNRPSVSQVSSSKAGQITVKWKKNKKAEGYEIQYATRKDFSNARTVSASGKKGEKKISKLKKDKKYYVRIRSVSMSSGTSYSSWSKAKNVRTAK